MVFELVLVCVCKYVQIDLNMISNDNTNIFLLLVYSISEYHQMQTRKTVEHWLCISKKMNSKLSSTDAVSLNATKTSIFLIFFLND